MSRSPMLAGSGSTHQAKRLDRHRARAFLWDNSTIKRVRSCGRVARDAEGVRVRVRHLEDGSRRAGFAGLVTCGSYWACPECSNKIAAHNQGEIEHALREWTSTGRRVALATFTVRHRAGQSLDQVWDAVTAGWSAATSGAGWKGDQRTYGAPTARLIRTGKRKGQLALDRRVWTIRVTETTYGRNGWHVHVHALLLLGTDATDESVAMLTDQMFQRWRTAVQRAGLDAPSWEHGRDGRLLHGDPSAALGEYFVKAAYSASHEVASGHTKSARRGNRTPFGILADVVRHGEARDWALWQEWERSSRGRRSMSWSPGLRQAVGLMGELTDEEKADLDAGGEDVAHVDRTTWTALIRHGGWLDLLEAFEVSDDAGMALLARWRAAAHDRQAA